MKQDEERAAGHAEANLARSEGENFKAAGKRHVGRGRYERGR